MNKYILMNTYEQVYLKNPACVGETDSETADQVLPHQTFTGSEICRFDSSIMPSEVAR